ncbi:Endo-1,4-beta-xylanase C [Hypsizygus marmoreus]|uniref:Endo-1,4-beta-xylanase C n=1 Tax=Hypsizygus marmoreus TaxID=39966 RepID=A0A369J4H8_HYPMA|nr:Endo-1,4-beta-xylanase C [Hypsizygus marmoreus]
MTIYRDLVPIISRISGGHIEPNRIQDDSRPQVVAMRSLTVVAALCSLIYTVTAQSPAWGQCGGQGWTGSTTCVAGYTCTVSNPYYSQCIPGTAPPTTTQNSSTGGPPGSTVSPTTTSSSPAATGSQIRTVQNPVFHFYLQNSGGNPVLGPESSSGRFTLGSTISLNSATGSKLYLNIDNSGSQSYKALTFGASATTTNWGLEGDTIITTSPRQLNFIACATSSSTVYDVYLQQGNDTPAGKSCTLVTLHLPCLC